jgi:hypothetical protein
MLQETLHRVVHFSYFAAGFAGREVQPHAAGTPELPPASAESAPAIAPEVYVAFFYGLLSAISFPIGSVLGIALSPVSPYVVALIIAFGAGSLLFAVTVELYGEQLKHLEEHGHHHEGVVEVGICLTMAFVGSLVYIALNRYVEGMAEADLEEDGKEGGDASTTKALESAEQGKMSPRRPESVSDDASSKATPRGEDGSEATPRGGAPARQKSAKWAKASTKVMTSVKLARMNLLNRRSKFGVSAAIKQKDSGDQAAKTLAFGMFVGVLADGLPEAILIGFLASSGKLSLMFVLSLFIANFPESFSASSLMYETQAFSSLVIFGMWTLPCVLNAVLAALACYLVPEDVQGLRSVEIIAASIEGLAGGMMLTMIAAVMLPEAFNMAKKSENIFNKISWGENKAIYNHHGADIPGVFCVAGFLLAVGLKVTGGVLSSVPASAEAHHFF